MEIVALDHVVQSQQWSETVEHRGDGSSAPPALKKIETRRANVPFLCCLPVPFSNFLLTFILLSGSASYPQEFITCHKMIQLLEVYFCKKYPLR